MQYEDNNMSFQDLKKSRGGFDTLQASLEKTSSGGETKSYNDERFKKRLYNILSFSFIINILYIQKK